MGGTSSQNQQQSGTTSQTTTPWAPASSSISGILSNLNGINSGLNPTQQAAINNLSGVGAAGNQFAPAIGGVASTLLGGGGPDRSGIINNAYAMYRQQMDPYANGQFNDPSTNPVLQKYLTVARDDATNSIDQQFAGAGRDLSGAHIMARARGVMQAEAPILYDAYNQSQGRQFTAANNTYGAGNTTGGLLSGLDQTRLGNMQAGIPAADSAFSASTAGPMLQLQAMSYQTGIPLQTLAAQMGIALPAGQAFGTTAGTNTGTATGSNTMSGAQQFALISGGMKNLFGGGGGSSGGGGILGPYGPSTGGLIGYPGFGVP